MYFGNLENAIVVSFSNVKSEMEKKIFYIHCFEQSFVSFSRVSMYCSALKLLHGSHHNRITITKNKHNTHTVHNYFNEYSKQTSNTFFDSI